MIAQNKIIPIFIVLFILTIYFSTTLAIIFSALLLIIWFVTGSFLKFPQLLKTHKVAFFSLFLYLFFIVALSYGDASTSQALSMLSKYRELLLIPIMANFFQNSRCRIWAYWAFIGASVITLLDSYLKNFGVLTPHWQGSFTYKNHITHSILLSFFAFYCVHRFYNNDRFKLYFLGLAILTFYDLFFVVQGRTGQLSLIVLIILFAFQRFEKKQLALVIVVLSMFSVAYLNFSSKASRIKEGIENTVTYVNHSADPNESSMGQRYTFWKNSLILIKERPLFGYGTGGFSNAYKRIYTPTTENPHNEFFMITVQLGFVGLMIYLAFLYVQYQQAKHLPLQEKWLAHGLLLTLITASFFNSPFHDHTEGHWFATLIALQFSHLTSKV